MFSCKYGEFLRAPILKSICERLFVFIGGGSEISSGAVLVGGGLGVWLV